ncbi:Conserved_hypothetical protein [Hexamita inflata]|uniref:Uncharacterized protein n=1 Tax=Hexamita inflata TaxID=28002 RepID=A0AA86QJS5_9EUKA|nr:Conserved hypothetical protein [Hexamita inflata]
MSSKPIMAGKYVSGGQRQKITNRPIRSDMGKVQYENAAVQEAQQQDYYRKKREEFEMVEQKMLKRINGTYEEKLEIQREEEAEMQLHLQQREIVKRRERELNQMEEMKMLEKIKYEEMLAKEKEQAELEYKQYLMYQYEQEQKLRNQNRQMEKEMQKLEDAESMNKFFQKHFAKSIR